MWKDKRNNKKNNIDDSINELLDAWMDVLSISMPMANMNDWVELPSKQQKKANPMSYEDRDKDIVFTIDMPGVQKKDIKINVEPNAINVKAENGGSRKYNYSRRFKPTVDVESSKATFKNGVLDITIQKKETKPTGKSIKIQ